jgi:hypothetical protein
MNDNWMDIDTQEMANSIQSPPHETPTPARTSTTIYKHTYKMLVKANPNDKHKEMFTRLQILQLVLTTFQARDSSTNLIIPGDSTTQQRHYSKINPNSKNSNENGTIEKLLHFTSNGAIQGTIQDIRLQKSTKKQDNYSKKNSTSTPTKTISIPTT